MPATPTKPTEKAERCAANSVGQVSHDAEFLDGVCTDVIHLDDEKLHQYSGNVTQFDAMRGQVGQPCDSTK